jgi:hypothetical protein
MINVEIGHAQKNHPDLFWVENIIPADAKVNSF